ncbi:glutamine synthetase, partial [Pseudomonas sp. HMWF010]
NPYLVMAVLLASAHHGLTQKLDPGPAVVGDGYAAAAKEKSRLPSNWFAAVDLFDQSTVLREYLGDRFVDMFVSVKRTEQARFFEAVTSLDFDWYLRNA